MLKPLISSPNNKQILYEIKCLKPPKNLLWPPMNYRRNWGILWAYIILPGVI